MSEEKKYDKIIIGAGIYGMYAAKRTLEKNSNEKVLILEVENTYFNRGSYINQARLQLLNQQNILIDFIMILKKE